MVCTLENYFYHLIIFLKTVGYMYYMGYGTKKDLEKAAKYYSLSAEKKYTLAMKNLG